MKTTLDISIHFDDEEDAPSNEMGNEKTWLITSK